MCMFPQIFSDVIKEYETDGPVVSVGTAEMLKI